MSDCWGPLKFDSCDYTHQAANLISLLNVQDADPEALSRIGEVLLVAGGRVDVLWADGTRSAAEPQQLFVVSGDDDMDGPVRAVLTF